MFFFPLFPHTKEKLTAHEVLLNAPKHPNQAKVRTVFHASNPKCPT